MIDPRKYVEAKAKGLMTAVKVNETKFVLSAKRFSEEDGTPVADEMYEITFDQLNAEIVDLTNALGCRQILLSDLQKQIV